MTGAGHEPEAQAREGRKSFPHSRFGLVSRGRRRFVRYVSALH
jgi:hypothetical protein